MNPSDRLTDELIQAAFERRARRADPGDLRETILTLSAASSQRSRWRVQFRSTMSTLVLRPALLKGVVAATVIGVIAVGAALFVMRSGDPTVGGPSPTPNATSSPNTPASPSAGPSGAVVAPRAPAWNATGGMIEARSQQTATLLPDGRVLMAGGMIGPPLYGSTASAELYDPSSGSWTSTGSMHGARAGQTATRLLNGTVLVAGGSGGGGGRDALATAELYDPSSGTWTATGDMLVAGIGHTATLLPNGNVLVVGGSGNPLVAELYDPASGTWAATGRPMIRYHVGHTATLLPDGRVLVAGGPPNGRENGSPTAELYDPSSGSWTVTGNMGRLRVGHTATLLVDGRVLVAGGNSQGGSESTASAEVYDPISGSWTVTGSMVTIQGGPATVLTDGRVLVAGGFSSNGKPLASAELYDPASGTWSATASMVAVRHGGTATLLPDGKVLVAGGLGVSGDSETLASAELYDPGSGN